MLSSLIEISKLELAWEAASPSNPEEASSNNPVSESNKLAKSSTDWVILAVILAVTLAPISIVSVKA